MNEKSTLRITGQRLREKRPCIHSCYKHSEKLVYVWPTEEIVDEKIIKRNLTIREMSAITGVKPMTINTRMRRYGEDHPDVFSVELLLHGNGLNYGAMPSGKAKRKIKPAFAAGTLEEKYL